MYFVLELQINSDGTIGNIITPHDTYNEAASQYHAILSAAAISSVARHSAVLLRDDGFELMYDTYEHPQQ